MTTRGGSMGTRSGGYHHGRFRHSIASLGIVPLYYVSESCDPATDPYCDPHRGMVVGEEVGQADIDTGDIPYYALDFVPEYDPYWDSLMHGEGESFLNNIGNAAGLASLGRKALLLGGIGALGYGAYLLTHPKGHG